MPAPVLFGASGNPEPSSEILRRLRALNPRLSLQFNGTGGNKVWAITLQWEENDRRREYVQRGEMPLDATFDIIGWLPLDCSVDEAPSYISRAFRQYPKEEVSNILNDIDKWNSSGVGAEHIKQVMQEMADNKYGFEETKVTGRRKRVKPSTE